MFEIGTNQWSDVKQETNASQNLPQLLLIKFSNLRLLQHIFFYKYPMDTCSSSNADYKLSQLFAPINMAFYNHILVETLILALSLSSTDASLAARHLLDTPAVSAANFVVSATYDQPLLPAMHPFLIHPKTIFSESDHPLPQVSNQPTQTNSSFLILSSTQTPSDQPKLPETTLPQSPTKHSTQIPSMPTEPTLPNTPINPKVKLSPLTATQLPSKLYTAAVHAADLAVFVIPYDLPTLRASHPNRQTHRFIHRQKCRLNQL
jgi:hypothetical protein